MLRVAEDDILMDLIREDKHSLFVRRYLKVSRFQPPGPHTCYRVVRAAEYHGAVWGL